MYRFNKKKIFLLFLLYFFYLQTDPLVSSITKVNVGGSAKEIYSCPVNCKWPVIPGG